jgi:hypothetical protein
MTIGIGVLCSSKPKPHLPRPDTIIMMADTMGSTETDSTEDLHKLYAEYGKHFVAVCAGNVEMAAEVVSLFDEQYSALTPKTHGGIWSTLNDIAHRLRAEHFSWDVIRTRYTPLPGQILESQQSKLLEEWQAYDYGLCVLLGTFDHRGMAHLYEVGAIRDEYGAIKGLVRPHLFPGHWAIGSGAYNATQWLNFRNQQLGLHPVQSAYHAYEAKIMASQAPTVNRNLEVVVAYADRHYFLSQEHPEVSGCPVSIPQLKKMFKQYGPRDANAIGHPSMFRRLTSKK